MTINKRKKTSRLRGQHTHGWGAKKRHRGHGSRGGTGLAGTGKRADTKKPRFWHEEYFGMHGIKSRNSEEKEINIRTINLKLDSWLTSKKIEKKGDIYGVNLGALEYDKLLSKGNPNFKLDITVKRCSPKAKEKIESNGGKITLTEEQAKKKAEAKPKEEPKKEQKAPQQKAQKPAEQQEHPEKKAVKNNPKK